MGNHIDRHLTGVEDMSQISEARLWKTLDTIVDRLSSMEAQLFEVVRLEERVNSHDKSLSRYGDRLDNHDSRLRDSELWQANHGDKASVERLITNIQEDLHDLKKTVSKVESKNDIFTGQKDIGKQILKWTVGVLTGILVYKFTRG